MYGHVCEPVCQCAGVRIVDYMLHRAANTRSPHASAQQPRFVCPLPRLAVVRECVCAYVCVPVCICVCACVRVFMDSGSKLNFAHNNDISHIAVRVMAIGWLCSWLRFWLWLRLWLWARESGIALGCLCLGFALFAIIVSPTFCLAYGIRMR